MSIHSHCQSLGPPQRRVESYINLANQLKVVLETINHALSVRISPPVILTPAFARPQIEYAVSI
jgi:hypothetical protein